MSAPSQKTAMIPKLLHPYAKPAKDSDEDVDTVLDVLAAATAA